MVSVIRHFFNKSGPDRIITIEGDAHFLEVRHIPSQRQIPMRWHSLSDECELYICMYILVQNNPP